MISPRKAQAKILEPKVETLDSSFEKETIVRSGDKKKKSKRGPVNKFEIREESDHNEESDVEVRVAEPRRPPPVRKQREMKQLTKRERLIQ